MMKKEEEPGRLRRLRLEAPVMKKSDEVSDLRPAPRMAAGDRRQQILDVAVKLFSQKGFRGTTTKEIALAAGVNEAIIFRHFATKSDLYAAIIDGKAGSANVKAVQNTIKEAAASGDDRELFESVAFHLLEFHEHDDTAMRLLLYSALEGHELAEMIFRNHISTTHRKLAEYVRRRISEGAFRRVDPGSAVRGFLGMVINHVMHKKFFSYDGNEALSITNRQAAERITELFLASMTNRNYRMVKGEK
jgi:AcrR family transcriptional regulator